MDLDPHGNSRAGRRQARKERALLFLGNACSTCGEDNPALLKFVHTDPETKLFDISQGWEKRWEDIEAELLKCELKCRTCAKCERAEQREAQIPDTDKHSYMHDWVRARYNRCTVCHEMLRAYNEEKRTRDSAANRWYEAEGVRWHRQLQAELMSEGISWDPEEWKAEN